LGLWSLQIGASLTVVLLAPFGGQASALLCGELLATTNRQGRVLCHDYQQQFVVPPLFILAVLADCLKALAVGAPLLPTLRIFSPEPSEIRSRFAAMLAYKPLGLLAMISRRKQLCTHWLEALHEHLL
jgi:hypothetical protein